MPWIEVVSYRLSVLHNPEADVTHHLLLQPAAGHEGPGRSGLHIHFSREPEDAGRVTGDVILARMPESRFSDAYRMLQTERPIYFSWEPANPTRGEEAEPLRSCALSTMQEPTGEGPSDRSR